MIWVLRNRFRKNSKTAIKFYRFHINAFFFNAYSIHSVGLCVKIVESMNKLFSKGKKNYSDLYISLWSQKKSLNAQIDWFCVNKTRIIFSLVAKMMNILEVKCEWNSFDKAWYCYTNKNYLDSNIKTTLDWIFDFLVTVD